MVLIETAVLPSTLLALPVIGPVKLKLIGVFHLVAVPALPPICKSLAVPVKPVPAPLKTFARNVPVEGIKLK